MGTKHHLIVEHEVTNIGSDHGQLSRMASSAKSAMGKLKLKVLADRGYFGGPDIRACELAGITAYVPKPLTSASRKKGLFTKRDFIYVARNDEYRCPAGQRATLRFRTVENGMNLNVYWPSACPRCHLKEVHPATIAASDDGSTSTSWKPCSVGSTGSPMR